MPKYHRYVGYFGLAVLVTVQIDVIQQRISARVRIKNDTKVASRIDLPKGMYT